MIQEEFESSSVSSNKRTHTERFGLLVGYGFFLNTVIGAGFLSIPFAYQAGGWLLSLLIQCGCILLGLVYAYMILETLSLVSSIDYLKQQSCRIPPIGFWKLFTESSTYSSLIERRIPTPKLTQNQYDMVEMTRILLGQKWAVLFMTSMSIMFFGSLIAYASIFGTSFASTVPLGGYSTCDVYNDFEFNGNCRWKYMVFVFIYGVFMVYLTCVGFKKQWWMQIIFTFMRFLVIFLIIICSIGAIATKTELSSADVNPVTMPRLANFMELGTILSILLFSTVFQSNIPGISVHIKNKKMNLPRILILLTISVLMLYVLMGFLAAVAIPNVSSMATLSFRGYSAGAASLSRSEWTYVLEFIVVIFPALDVFSIFPLIAINLADNFAAILFNRSSKEIISKVEFM
jgi:amino acid permease